MPKLPVPPLPPPPFLPSDPKSSQLQPFPSSALQPPPGAPPSGTRQVFDVNNLKTLLGKKFSSDPVSKEASEVESCVQKLTASSRAINALSKALTEQVCEIEDTINGLNLGIKTDVLCKSSFDEDGIWTKELNLCWGKFNGHWGFIVEEHEKDRSIGNPDQQDTYRHWLFRDAPRELRLAVVDKIPELLKSMVTTADGFIEQIAEKTSFVSNINTGLAVLRLTREKK